jgi:hypothetical protein
MHSVEKKNLYTNLCFILILAGVILWIAIKLTKPMVILEANEKFQSHSVKTVLFNIPKSGRVSIGAQVSADFPLDIYLITASDLENLKNNRSFDKVGEFGEQRTSRYRRSGALKAGTYYLIMHDKKKENSENLFTEVNVSIHLIPNKS